MAWVLALSRDAAVHRFASREQNLIPIDQSDHCTGGADPREHGYVLAFAVCGGALVVAAIVALMIPTRSRPSVVLGEWHPALTAEAEVVIGAIGYVAGPVRLPTRSSVRWIRATQTSNSSGAALTRRAVGGPLPLGDHEWGRCRPRLGRLGAAHRADPRGQPTGGDGQTRHRPHGCRYDADVGPGYSGDLCDPDAPGTSRRFLEFTLDGLRPGQKTPEQPPMSVKQLGRVLTDR